MVAVEVRFEELVQRFHLRFTVQAFQRRLKAVSLLSQQWRNDQESREACARTKAAAALFAVICLLSQILGPNLTPNFGFPVKRLAIMS